MNRAQEAANKVLRDPRHSKRGKLAAGKGLTQRLHPLHGRRQPYTDTGIRRLPCYRCGEPAVHQWQICADDNLYRPLCVTCDVALNRLVLRFMGFVGWRRKIAAYVRRRRDRG